MNEPRVKTDPAAVNSAEFFDRARGRLRFDIPAGLTDPSLVPSSGDQGTDRMLQILSREQPIRPAAVLIPAPLQGSAAQRDRPANRPRTVRTIRAR